MYQWLLRLFVPSKSKGKKIKATPSTPTIATVPTAAPPIRSTASLLWTQREEVNANFNNWLFNGDQDADLFTNQTEENILSSIDKIVKSKESGANLVRRMPGVIPQLLNSLRTEDFSGTELANKIAKDVVLVGEVIRLANSSFYNPRNSINSIEYAVLVLGQAGLRQLITSVAFKPILDFRTGQVTQSIAARIWEQSEQCAIANRILAMDERRDPFETFLAGLAQNVGLIVALRVIDQLDGTQRIGSASFCNQLMGYARTLSCRIAKDWRFPDAVIGAIEEQGSNLKSADMSPTGKTLSMGDYLSKLNLLISHNLCHEEDLGLAKHLTDKELDCLKALKSLQITE